MTKGFAIVAALAIALASWFAISRWRSARWRPALASREVATRVMASYLAQQFPGAKLLVVGNPFTLKSGQHAEIYEFEQASIRGIQEGFGLKEAVKVAHPELRPAVLDNPSSVYVDPKTTTPLSYLVADEAFDRILEANPGYDLVITLIGLPANIRNSRVWQTPAAHRFGLLLPDWRVLGPPADVVAAFKSGKIAAAVLNRPGTVVPAGPVQSSDIQAEFDQRFVLATSNNVERLMAEFPHAF